MATLDAAMSTYDGNSSSQHGASYRSYGGKQPRAPPVASRPNPTTHHKRQHLSGRCGAARARHFASPTLADDALAAPLATTAAARRAAFAPFITPHRRASSPKTITFKTRPRSSSKIASSNSKTSAFTFKRRLSQNGATIILIK